MNRTIGVAIPLALVLLAFLALISCTPESGNSNRGITGSVNRDEGTATFTTPVSCLVNETAANRAANLNAHWTNGNNANTNDTDVDGQRGNRFKVEFDVDGNLVVVRVKGSLISKMPNGNALKPKLSVLVNHLEQYLKKGCADVISFELDPQNNRVNSVSGFEWILCDGNEVPCPGGRCSVGGQCLFDKPEETLKLGNTSNGNVGGGSNSNTNSNSNSNANAKTSSRPG